MSSPYLSSETRHASTVAIGGRAILIGGRSGAGKSDLALRLIDRGARLVSDDYTLLRRVSGRLIASAPGNIAGRMEVRGVGILPFDAASDVPVALYVDLEGQVQRLPEPQLERIIGVDVPMIAVNSLEASAPLKVEIALAHFGLALD